MKLKENPSIAHAFVQLLLEFKLGEHDFIHFCVLDESNKQIRPAEAQPISGIPLYRAV
jgi:hypothetical protein